MSRDTARWRACATSVRHAAAGVYWLSTEVSMSVRSLVVCGALAFAVASAQPTKGWAIPFTSDGQPDLQGNWMNKNATPLERPKQLEGREFLTDAELAELKARAVRIFGGGNSDAANGDAVFLAAL